MNIAARLRPALPRELHARGILGVNRRNTDYIIPENPRAAFPLVDDKVLTKQICHENDIPAAATYAVIKTYHDAAGLTHVLAAHSQFVLKPARGAAGRGVLVISRHDENLFHLAGQAKPITRADLVYHVGAILGGLYSLGGRPDCVIVEERIAVHPDFKAFGLQGTPDIRLIVYRGHPVMAMLRLPTAMSRGRANLHQGAVGAGIDMHSGQTIAGVCMNQPVCVHPDTHASVTGFQVRDWPVMLALAAQLAHVLQLGYIGVDLIVDVKRGPIVLEANARPGLSIQIANDRGLIPSLAVCRTLA